jgi:hypothetical protein
MGPVSRFKVNICTKVLVKVFVPSTQ